MRDDLRGGMSFFCFSGTFNLVLGEFWPALSRSAFFNKEGLLVFLMEDEAIGPPVLPGSNETSLLGRHDECLSSMDHFGMLIF